MSACLPSMHPTSAPKVDRSPQILLRCAEPSDEHFCFWLASIMDPAWCRVSRAGVPRVGTFRSYFRSRARRLQLVEGCDADRVRRRLGVAEIDVTGDTSPVASIAVVLRPDLVDHDNLVERAAFSSLLAVAKELGARKAFAWRLAHDPPPSLDSCWIVREALLPGSMAGPDGPEDVAVYGFTWDDPDRRHHGGQPALVEGHRGRAGSRPAQDRLRRVRPVPRRDGRPAVVAPTTPSDGSVRLPTAQGSGAPARHGLGRGVVHGRRRRRPGNRADGSDPRRSARSWSAIRTCQESRPNCR